MELKNRVQEMDSLVSQGRIIEAVESFFCTNARTSDYGNVVTQSKSEMIGKMNGFMNSIESVNGISHHKTIVDGNTSASEFTFDFEMKEGGPIFWHEVIVREWNNEGLVVKEEYFNASN